MFMKHALHIMAELVAQARNTIRQGFGANKVQLSRLAELMILRMFSYRMLELRVLASAQVRRTPR
jgi:hypothetical protein